MKLPERIVHQKQPCDKSCARTVAAMIVHKSVDFVDIPAPTPNEEVHAWLRDQGLKVTPQNSPNLRTGFLQILCMPSPNKRGVMHSVLLDLRNYGDDIGQRLFDPNQGRDRKDYYTDEELFGGQISWGFVTLIEDGQ